MLQCCLGRLWALRLGIRTALDLQLPWVIFKMDSKVIVEMVHSRCTKNNFLKPLLHEVISLLQLPFWRTSLLHVYREANKCADLLANKGHFVPCDGAVLDSSFPLLDLYIFTDVRGVSTPRLIN